MKPPRNSNREKLILSKINIRERVIIWNHSFPVDYWWRTKHGVPFGSRQHLEMDFIRMAFEYIEWVEFELLKIKELVEKKEADIKNNESPFAHPNEIRMNKREIQAQFDELDLDQFNDQKQM